MGLDVRQRSRSGLPHAGDLVFLGRAASVQFSCRPITVRVIRFLDRDTYHGWIWLDGYELDERGNAVDRRNLFVLVAGIRRVTATPHRSSQPLQPAGRVRSS